MDSLAMTEFETRLDAGDVVHLWQKAPTRDAVSEVRVTRDGAELTVLPGARSDDFTRTVFEAPAAGTYRFAWNEPATLFSVAA